MSEVLIPPWIIPEDEEQEPLDEGSSVFGAAFAPGLSQRQSYGGLRLKLSRQHTVRAEEKAQLLSALKGTRGRYNALRSKVHFALRGSFPATELLTNNTFASGVTGWTAQTGWTLSASNRILRATYNGAASASSAPMLQNVALSAYTPYAVRAMTSQGRGAMACAAYLAGISGTVQAISAPGYSAAASAVNPAATYGIGLLNNLALAGLLAGDYVDIAWISASRCALVDDGLNSLLHSDAPSNAAWSKNGATISTGPAAGAPDFSSQPQYIQENSSAGQHYISQVGTRASATADLCAYGYFKSTNRDIQLVINDGAANGAICSFSLSAGTAGTPSLSGTGTNARAFIRDAGNSWYFCSLIARCPATTSIRMDALMVSGGTNSYTGDGASLVLAWRLGAALTSVPTRGALTTSAAVTGSSQTGSALHIKGLPASTAGLLVPEDVFELNGELKACTAALNSDATGLGYLQFEPALVRSPADNDPVIVLDPMGKFLMSNFKIENEFGTQARVAYDLEHIYE